MEFFIVFHNYPFHTYKVCSSSFSFQILLICTTSFFFVGLDRSSWTLLIFFRNSCLFHWFFFLLFYWFQLHWILLLSLLFLLLALVLICSSFLRWELELLIWDFLSFLKHAVSVVILPSAMLWLCVSHKFPYVLFSFSSVYFSNLP